MAMNRVMARQQALSTEPANISSTQYGTTAIKQKPPQRGMPTVRPGQTLPTGGTAAGGGGSAQGNNAPDPRAQEDALYKDILDSHKNAWSGIEQGHVANMATMQRRAAAINAAMGRSVGGGFASSMGQAFIGGQNQLDQARLQHEQQGRNLQLDWLDKMVRRRERDEDLAERAASAEAGVPGMPPLGVNESKEPLPGWKDVDGDGMYERPVSGDATPSDVKQVTNGLYYSPSTQQYYTKPPPGAGGLGA